MPVFFSHVETGCGEKEDGPLSLRPACRLFPETVNAHFIHYFDIQEKFDMHDSLDGEARLPRTL